MGEQAVQVAFMLDTRSTTSDVLLRHRSLCLACTRVLFGLSGFPNRAQQKCVRWKYVFFNERKSANLKVPHFMEVNMSCVESMYKELHSELRSSAVETQVKQLPVSVLRSALVDVVQRTVWDSPDILSPPKTRARKTGTRKGGKWRSTLETEPLSIVIVCSQWPGQLDQLTENLFPSDLNSFLMKNNINVFWLYEGDTICNDKAMRGVHEAVALTGGSVINLSTIVSPPTNHCVHTQVEVEGKQMKGYETQIPLSVFMQQSILVTSGRNGAPVDPEFLWLCSNANDPVCIIQVEPLHPPTSVIGSRNLMAGIQLYNLCVRRSGREEEICRSGSSVLCGTDHASADHAVIVGVLRQRDVPKLWLQPILTYSSTGLHVPLASIDRNSWLKVEPDEVLQGSMTFSREYQNLCLRLASNKMLLLLEVRYSTEVSGLCILQPSSSVMGILSVLKPHYCSNIEAVLLKQPLLHTSNLFSNGGVQEEALGSLENVTEKKACIYQPDLYCSLQMLFAAGKGEMRGVPIISAEEQQEISANGDVFTIKSVLPWYPFVESHGIPSVSLQTLNDLQLKTRYGYSRKQRLADMLSKMKVASANSKSIEEKSKADMQSDVTSTALKFGILQGAANTEETMKALRTSYDELLHRGGEGLKLQQWVSCSLGQLQKGLEGKQLFPTVQEVLLMSTEQLERKYDHQDQAYSEKMTEYQLQVLLRLEVCQLSGMLLNESYSSLLSTQVTKLLRRISLLAKPAFLGHFMKEIILPNYSTACQKLLLSVCEELLLPVPVELGGSPISMSPHDVGAEESPSSTTCEETNDKHSLPNEMPTSVSSNTRSLVRCASFQDKRQITVPSHKHKVGHLQEDLKRVCGEAGKSNKEPKKVCRTLFNRSMSLNTDNRCKRQYDEEDSCTAVKKTKVDFVVKETPVKKQVENYRRFKLQRLRSKVDMNSSKEVVIEESPRRSFYQSKRSNTKSFPSVTKHVEPSPKAMKALLQGTMLVKSDTESVDSMSLRTAYASKTSSLPFYESEEPLTKNKDLLVQPPTHPPAELQDLTDKWTPP